MYSLTLYSLNSLEFHCILMYLSKICLSTAQQNGRCSRRQMSGETVGPPGLATISANLPVRPRLKATQEIFNVRARHCKTLRALLF